jgi:hypothetical protein
VQATATSPQGRDARVLGTWIAALTPLLAMLAGGAAFSLCGNQDDGVVSAALGLSPTATSGYPLAALLAHAFTYLPLGPLVLRIALASSSAIAVAAGALYAAIHTSLRTAAIARSTEPVAVDPAPLVRSPLALGIVLFAFGCDALFCTEPRAYSVSLALACLCLERVSAVQASWPRRTPEPLRAAAFWFGLLAVEQPALALVLLLGGLPWLRRMQRVYSLSRLAVIALPFATLLALGLLRLDARTPPALVAAAGELDFARAFDLAARSTPMLQRLRPLGMGAWGLFGFVLFALVRFIRTPAPARTLELWLTITATSWLASLLLAHASALFALALCTAAATCALTLSNLLENAERNSLALAVALLGVVLGGAHLRATALRHMAEDARASDLLRDPLLRTLPPRATLLAEPDLARSLYAAELEERCRPDVRSAVKPWRLDLPGCEALSRAAPELEPLMRAHLLQGELPIAELQTLAMRRPLLIESSAAGESTLSAALLPFGWYHQVSTSMVSRNDERFAARDAEQNLHQLWSTLEGEPLDACTRHRLVERAQADADYYRQLGDPERVGQASSRAAAVANAVAKNPAGSAAPNPRANPVP